MERKFTSFELKETNAQDLVVTAVISVEKRDRVGDLMRSAGCHTDSTKIPILYSHGFGSPIGNEPVGKCERLWVGQHQGSPAVLAKVRFFPDDQGVRLFQKISQGYLDGWSVGFIPEEYENFHDSVGGRDIKVWQILEASATPTPCNQYTTTLTEAEKSQALEFKFFTGSSNQGVSDPEFFIKLGNRKIACQTFLRNGRMQIHIPDEVLSGMATETMKSFKSYVSKLMGKVQ